MAERNDQNRGRNQQQGGRDSLLQQQQFDSGTRQAGGGGDAGSTFGGQIREHMEVFDADDTQIGTVDHVDGDRIKLTRDGTAEHRYLALSQVAGIEDGRVRLRDRGDATFGIEGDR